jgi:hypothetical protein
MTKVVLRVYAVLAAILLPFWWVALVYRAEVVGLMLWILETVIWAFTATARVMAPFVMIGAALTVVSLMAQRHIGSGGDA